MLFNWTHFQHLFLQIEHISLDSRQLINLAATQLNNLRRQMTERAHKALHKLKYKKYKKSLQMQLENLKTTNEES